ncbi:hypothetical protein IU444_11460 [Nocardia farcinica]|nr:hypothetical protein [Nocardia farcinica]
MTGAFGPGHDRDLELFAGCPLPAVETLRWTRLKTLSIAVLYPAAPTRPSSRPGVPVQRMDEAGGIDALQRFSCQPPIAACRFVPYIPAMSTIELETST